MNSQPTIHRDMIVGDVVSMFPEAADIIMSYGLHCVGCHANAFETLGQGMLGHGYTEDNLQDMLEELNEAWDEMYGSKAKKVILPEAENMTITVTELAREKTLHVAELEKKSGWFLRIKAKPGPAEKVRFAMDFEKEAKPDDKVLEFPHEDKIVTVILDKHDYEKLNNITIDYVKKNDAEGFKISSAS